MKTIKNLNQKQLADLVGISSAALSNILRGKFRPEWKNAKNLAAATGTDPVLWLEGSVSEIREAIGLLERKPKCPTCGR